MNNIVLVPKFGNDWVKRWATQKIGSQPDSTWWLQIATFLFLAFCDYVWANLLAINPHPQL